MVGEYQLLEEEVNGPEVFFVFLPITVTSQNDLSRFWPFATTIAHSWGESIVLQMQSVGRLGSHASSPSDRASR